MNTFLQLTDILKIYFGNVFSFEKAPEKLYRTKMGETGVLWLGLVAVQLLLPALSPTYRSELVLHGSAQPNNFGNRKSLGFQYRV